MKNKPVYLETNVKGINMQYFASVLCKWCNKNLMLTIPWYAREIHTFDNEIQI